MGSAIGNILPEAIAVAISPVPIIALILMLFSKKAKANSLAFLIGWILGLAAVCAIVMAVGNTQNMSSGSGASNASYTLKLLLGVLFLFLAFRNWRKRPKPGEQPKMPGWMSTIDSVKPGKAFMLAVLFSAINPKNLVLTVAAALDIVQDGLAAGQAAVVMAVFICIASLTIAIPVLINFFMKDRSTKMLNTWKEWLTENNSTVMFILLLVFGVVLLGKGISGLSG
jgi:threonine/homoserine/homoserine lactone efflux protein